MKTDIMRKDYQGARQYFDTLKQRFPETEWQGYYWMSDSMTPVVCNTPEAYLPVLETLNPFITEGWLYQEGSNLSISISIQMVDGSYGIGEYLLDGKEVTTEDTYFRNKAGEEVGKIAFKTVWEPVADELCAGFEVLKPVASVFTGFINAKI